MSAVIKDAVQGSKSRMWFLTVNSDLDANFDKLKSYECKYKVIGEVEEATTGHKHFHAVLYFNNPRNFSALHKRLPGINLQVGYGTLAQARAYAGKEGIRLEVGEAPHQGIKMSVADLKKASNEELYMNYGKDCLSFMRIREMLNSTITADSWRKEVQVFYFFGPSGSGKSEYARNLPGALGYEGYDEASYVNGFWNGIKGEAKACVFDDFRDSDMKPNEFIKFIDYNRHVLNIKNASVKNNYNLIVITSIKSPYKIYGKAVKTDGKEPRAQWLRRMRVFEFTEWGVHPKEIPYEPKTKSKAPVDYTPDMSVIIGKPILAPPPSIDEDDSSEDPNDPANYDPDYLPSDDECSADFC